MGYGRLSLNIGKYAYFYAEEHPRRAKTFRCYLNRPMKFSHFCCIFQCVSSALIEGTLATASNIEEGKKEDRSWGKPQVENGS